MERRGERHVTEFLVAAGHEPAVIRFAAETHTARATAEELGVPESRIVKSLVLVADGTTPVLALLPGHRRADLALVGRALGASRVRLASPEQVLSWTGYAVGSVPPVSHRQKMRILVDEDIPRDGDIYPAAGEVNNAFRTTFASLLALSGGTAAALSRQDPLSVRDEAR